MAIYRPRPADPTSTPPEVPSEAVRVAARDTRSHARGTAVSHCDDHGTWLISFAGEHDLASIAQVEAATRCVWPHCKVAVIDLSAVTFLDSRLVEWLLGVERRLEAADCFTLSIVTGHPGCATARLFDRLRMQHVLACYPTRRDAFMQAVAGADAISWPPLAADTLGADMHPRRQAA